MNYKEFVAKWSGKGIDYDGYYGFQCLDLAHQYAVEVNGKDIPPAPGAKDEWTISTPGYDKIKNTPTAVPQQGDIVIWGSAIGAFGHIAIFDSGDTNNFTSFDQNWPINSPCHFQPHNYSGVLGWLTLTNPPTPPPVISTPSGTVINWNQKTTIPLDPPYKNTELGAVNSMLKDKDRDLKNANNNAIALTQQLSECQKFISHPPIPQDPTTPQNPTIPPVVTPTTPLSFWDAVRQFFGLK